jgi:hypothetical protein
MAVRHSLRRYRTAGAATIVCVVFILFQACRNPFFPLTGMPDPLSVSTLRATPAGVIEQLKKAYEEKRRDLYIDLFPLSGSFRFYVSPQFRSTYQSLPIYNDNLKEARDTLLKNIGNDSYYYYWPQDIEIQAHKKLFDKAVSIVFSVPPIVNPGDFNYIVNSHGDTTNVEMLMTDGEIHIIWNDPDVGYVEEVIEIDKQVFYLERDASNLWVIRKWYDFGSQS